MARSELRVVDDDVLDKVTDEDVDEVLEDDQEPPAYELIGDASIPVSRKAGIRWKGKIDDALAAYENERAKWDLTYQEYRKCGNEGISNENSSEYRFHFKGDTDENLIRENVKLLLRSTYTRNPKIEISSTTNEHKPLAKVLELAASSLLNRKTQPGLNGKARVRRAIVHAHMTNMGLLKLGFQEKTGSRQEALQELYSTREKLAKTKKIEEIEMLYAELEQVEDELPLRNNAGMSLHNTLPHRFIVDPHCTNTDLSDADWVAEEVFFKTSYIQSRFLERAEEGANRWIRKSDGKETTSNSGDFSAEGIQDKVSEQILGFTSEERAQLLAKGMTRCYIIWDKVTREILLFSDDDWDYPLWVYEDTLKLSRFFQHHVVAYNEPIDGIVQPGETSYYIGQTKEINRINARLSYIRRLAFGAVIFNSRNQKPETVEKLLRHMKNPGEVDAFGLDFDPEKSVNDIITAFVPPDANYRELFDKSDLMKTVDRMNVTNPAQRGEQYKTNTTNKAISDYNETTATVANELTDVVEDALEELAWSMCEILVSKYTKEDIAALIGQEQAENFQQLSVQEFNTDFGLTIAAGSTEKPTSENKKKEAITIAQAIGQVGQATPMTSMMIITRMFQEAFSEFLVTDNDFDMLRQEAQAFMTKGQSDPNAGGGGNTGPVTQPPTP